MGEANGDLFNFSMFGQNLESALVSGESPKKEEVDNKKTDIVVDSRLLDHVFDRVKTYQKLNKEFFVYLLGKDGMATLEVAVGGGYDAGVTFTTQEAVEKLTPFIEQGYSIVADLHNHPDTGMYVTLGYGFESETTPSEGDLGSPAFYDVPVLLHQNPFPRVIVAYDESRNMFAVNAFHQNRDILTQERIDWTIEGSVIEQEPDELGIVISNYNLDPNQLVNHDVITLLNLRSVNCANGNTEIIRNCMDNSSQSGF